MAEKPNPKAPDCDQPTLSNFLKANEHRAREIIFNAERDLGRLDNAQRRDLLTDNTEWSRYRIFEIVAYIDKIDETEDAV